MLTQKRIKEWRPEIIESFIKAKPDITAPMRYVEVRMRMPKEEKHVPVF